MWVRLGSIYRSFVNRPGHRTSATTRIGGYGPFAIDGVFAFSDLEHWGGAHNEAFAACIERARGTTCAIDVGAHVGFVTLPLSQVVGTGARVVAFEPGEVNRRVLLRHLELNQVDNVVVVDALVGAAPVDDVDFWERMDVPTGMNSVAARSGGDHVRTTRRQITLDDYCEEHALSPAVVKIDVEGAELGVLRGAANMLQATRPHVFLSVHPRGIAELGGSLDELRELAADLGYVWRHADGTSVEGTLEMTEYVLVPREELPA